MAWTAPRTWVTGEVVTAAQMNTHVRDNFNALDRGVYGARVVGTAGGLGERWHMAGVLGHQGDGFGNSTYATATFHAFPFIAPRGGTLDRIGIRAQTGVATSKCRAGIYQATSESDPYPSALIVDSGEFDCSTSGIKSSNINIVLEPDILYWAVILPGTAGPNLVNTFSNTWSTFGTPIGIDPGLALSAPSLITRSQTYGAMPSTFPAGPPTSFANGSLPIIGIRYSA